MFRNSGGEKIEKHQKSHFCANLVPARPVNFWSRGVKSHLREIRMINELSYVNHLKSVLREKPEFSKIILIYETQTFPSKSFFRVNNIRVRLKKQKIESKPLVGLAFKL